MFHIRRKPSDLYTRKRKKKQTMKEFASETALMHEDRFPFLLEMNPDGSDIGPSHGRMPQRFRLAPNMTEVGSDPAIQSGQCLLLPPGTNRKKVSAISRFYKCKILFVYQSLCSLSRLI
jgi:hypothetical protein